MSFLLVLFRLMYLPAKARVAACATVLKLKKRRESSYGAKIPLQADNIDF